ncbi:MAG: diguanylate cyclase [Candidatus Pelethousia sp.]|nr:diguanylate cyclase [Candidatus Pelethousia sp.]
MKVSRLFIKAFLAAALLLLPAAHATAAGEAIEFEDAFHEHGAIMMLVEPESGRILYANSAASEFYGYSKAQLTSMNMADIATKGSAQTARQALASGSSESHYSFLEQRLADGELRTVELYARLADLNGTPVLSCVIHDVTDEVMLKKALQGALTFGSTLGVIVLALLLRLLHKFKKQAEALARANKELANFAELWTTFYDADASYVYLKDESLNYVLVNRAFKELYQLPYDKIIGYNDYALMAPQYAEIYMKSDREALEQNKMIVRVTPWENKVFKTTKFPVRLTSGALGIGAYVSDITEEYHQQRERERALKRNRLLLDALSQSFGNTQEQLNYVLNGLLELSGSQYGYIFFYNEERQEFIINSWTHGVMQACKVQDAPAVYKLEETGIWGEVVRQRQAVIVNDFEQPNTMCKGYPEGHIALKKFMSVPVIIDGHIVAAVGLANKETDYDETDVNEMTMLMSGVWNAVKRRETNETLAYERNKYYQTLLSIGDGVMVVDRNQNIEFLNDVACRLTGWSLDEARGMNYKQVFVLSHERAGADIIDPIASVFRTHEIQELGNHAILTSRQGARYALADSAAPIIADESGTLAGVVLVFRDVTEKKEQQSKIEYMSFHDALTGLYNRRFFEEEVRRLDTARNRPITILMGDVDSLKLTNDIFGHAAGDLLLCKVAAAMQKVCRSDDIIARWGGDEFVLLLPKTGSVEAEKLARRICNELGSQQIRAVQCSISLGHATKTADGEDIMEVLGAAEAKMYAVKSVERADKLSRGMAMLISAFFEKSESERQHALRMRELCRRIGGALGLPESDVHRLMEAGYLHDIGKVILDPARLQGIVALNAAEESDMRKHPVIGYRILSYFDATLELAEAALAHHESWDGSGYPKGLSGERIPFFARILTAVEAYDRMLHNPDPALAKTPQEAIREIRNRAGVQFDPRVAATLADMLEAEASAPATNQDA